MNLGVVGLGYVGLPLAVAFSKSERFNVIGFDINKEKIDNYANGIDVTNEIEGGLKGIKIKFTNEAQDIKEMDFIVIAVPTPVNGENKPDFTPLERSK